VNQVLFFRCIAFRMRAAVRPHPVGVEVCFPPMRDSRRPCESGSYASRGIRVRIGTRTHRSSLPMIDRRGQWQAWAYLQTAAPCVLRLVLKGRNSSDAARPCILLHSRADRLLMCAAMAKSRFLLLSLEWGR